MPHTTKAEPLHMGWCLDCHREPASPQRPSSDAVFDRDWRPATAAPPSTPGAGNSAAPRYEHLGVEVPPLTRCSVCHR